MPHRLVFALDLVDDAALIAAYGARHAPGAVWPEVLADIRQRGFLEMEIWSVADRLVMIAEVADDFPRPAAAGLEAHVAAWEAEMDRFQRPILEHGPKWAAMQRLFSLADNPVGDGASRSSARETGSETDENA